MAVACSRGAGGTERIDSCRMNELQIRAVTDVS
jgi:hypothetical protein